MTALPADYTPGTVHALLISPGGEFKVAQLTPSLGTYQRVVGAFVAIYYPDLRWHVYCHEATSLNVRTDVPANTVATDLARWADPSWERLIRGTAVIVGTGHNGQDLDVPAELLRHLKGKAVAPPDATRKGVVVSKPGMILCPTGKGSELQSKLKKRPTGQQRLPSDDNGGPSFMQRTGRDSRSACIRGRRASHR